MQVPRDFKDASIVYIHKRKGGKTFCDNHRGISRLCIAKIILYRLITHIADSNVPEPQCAFRAGSGTSDVVFAARQLREKNHEPSSLTVQRSVLWTLFANWVAPRRAVNAEVMLNIGKAI